MADKCDLEETLKRIILNKGTIGVIISDKDGIPIKTTLDSSTTHKYTDLMPKLSVTAKHVVRDLDPQDDLRFLRIRTKKHEVMVAPATGSGYMMVAIHNPSLEK